MNGTELTFKERIKRSGKIFIVGVAGDSGSGKTTFVQAIREILGEDIVSTFSLDDYHSLDRDERKKLGVTPLNPESNNLAKLEKDLYALKKGETIKKPVYDHTNGTFKAPVDFSPTSVIIIEGLLPFYTQGLRDACDFKIYVDPDRKIKRRWKIRRDVEQRGHDKESVLAEIRMRDPEYKKYIDVQKIYAEVVIKIHESGISPNKDINTIELIQEILDIGLDEMELSIDLSTLLRLSKKDFALKFQSDDYYGSNVGMLTLDGEIHRDVAQQLEAKLCRYTGRMGCGVFDPSKEYLTTTNIAQLIVCWRFIEKINYLLRE